MTPKQQYYEKAAATVIQNFKKRGIEGYYCPTSKDAVAKAMDFMDAPSVVSWGGSMTLEECGMMEALQNSGHTLLDRHSAATPEEKKELMSKIYVCDYFFMSSNAITLDGQLVNIDGAGNRVSCMAFGPSTVIVMAGMNKLVPDVKAGMDRVRNMAAPPNNIRLDHKTPCAVTGKCEDCLSPECICSFMVVTRRSHIPGRIKVILIGEELGY